MVPGGQWPVSQLPGLSVARRHPQAAHRYPAWRDTVGGRAGDQVQGSASCQQ